MARFHDPMRSPAELLNAPSLAHVLRDSVRANRDGLAFADERRRLTFGELYNEAERVAGALAAAGVHRGDRIALLLPAGTRFPCVFWGLQLLGAVPCALNPYSPPALSVRRAQRIRPRLVIYDPGAVGGFTKYASELPSFTLDELLAENGPAPQISTTADDLAWLQPTSGTSGDPRFAMIRQSNIIQLLYGMFLEQMTPGQLTHVAWVPPWHDLGLVRFMITPVAMGVPCHIVPPAIHTIPTWLETISRERAGVSGAPDFAYRLATQLVPSSLDLSTLRYSVSGGEPVRYSTIRKFEEHFGIEGAIHPGYGLAEATLGVAFRRFADAVVVDERGNVSCGRPAPNAEIRIDSPDESGAGEILVRGPIVFAGYFEAPEATAEVLRDGWLHTGDIGRLDPSGQLFVLGRRKAMLKRGGAVVAPRELEDAALQVEGVHVAAALSIPPSEGQSTETIAMTVEMPRGGESPEAVAQATARVIREELGFAPDRVVVLRPRGILLTWNGKVRHDALRTDLLTGALQARGDVLYDSAG